MVHLAHRGSWLEYRSFRPRWSRHRRLLAGTRPFAGQAFCNANLREDRPIEPITRADVIAQQWQEVVVEYRAVLTTLSRTTCWTEEAQLL